MEVYGNVVETPVYNQIEETNEIYFSIKVKTINQEIIKFALASSVDNDYEKYELGRPIYASVIENEFGLKIANEIKFLSQRDLIDEALKKYNNKEINLEQYIQVCKDNKTYLSEDIKREEVEKIEYERNIARKPHMNQKYKAKGEIIKGYSENELYEIIENYLKEVLELNDIDTDIVNFQIIGSRNKGVAKANSDLDVLIEYNNDCISEDSFFDILNNEEDKLIIADIEVDFNPITSSKSGTLEEWLERNYNFDKYKENMKEYARYIINSLKEKFKDEISYVYKITFLKDNKTDRYTVSLAIDIDNNGSKNQINFISADKFYKLNHNEQVKYIGNFYNASIMGKRKEDFGYDEAKKDFLLMCDFNYIRDKEEEEL